MPAQRWAPAREDGWERLDILPQPTCGCTIESAPTTLASRRFMVGQNTADMLTKRDDQKTPFKHRDALGLKMDQGRAESAPTIEHAANALQPRTQCFDYLQFSASIRLFPSGQPNTGGVPTGRVQLRDVMTEVLHAFGLPRGCGKVSPARRTEIPLGPVKPAVPTHGRRGHHRQRQSPRACHQDHLRRCVHEYLCRTLDKIHKPHGGLAPT